MRDYHKRVADARERFANDTAGHTMTILHDDGLYRHIRYRQPDASFYWFDLITWPGCLVISGDMGAYHFSRLQDMFEFFGPQNARGGFEDAKWGINPDYWSEKLHAPAPRDAKVYSEDTFKAKVRCWFDERADGLTEEEATGLLAAVDSLLDDPDGYLADESEARRRVDEFQHDGHQMDDAWEWELREYGYSFLWCC